MLLLYGNAYVWIQRDRFNKPVALWPMLSWQTRPHVENGEDMFVTYLDGEYRAFFPGEVIHLERMCIDCTAGEELVDHARDAFGLALARQGYMSDFYRAGGRLGGKLRIPQNFNHEARQQVVDGFRKLYNTTGSAFLTYVAKDGVDFDESAYSLKDSETIEGLRASNRTVAQYYNIHPSKIGEEHKSAYSSKAEDNRDYLDTTLSPYTEQTEQELEMKLFDLQTLLDDRLYFEYNTDKLLRMNLVDRANVYSTLRQANIISPNEARRRENMPGYPGGDTYDNPNTTAGGEQSPSNETPQAHHIVNAPLTESQRDLLQNQIELTVRAATNRIRRQANDTGTFTKNRFETVVEQTQPVVDAAARVFRAIAPGEAERLTKATRACVITAFDDATQVEVGENFRHRLGESLKAIAVGDLVYSISQLMEGTACDSQTT